MNKTELLNAVIWFFGFTKKEATAYLKTASKETQQAILEGWNDQAEKAFYND